MAGFSTTLLWGTKKPPQSYLKKKHNSRGSTDTLEPCILSSRPFPVSKMES
jgi:hypothetical protein